MTLHRPSLSCDRNCSGRPGGGRSTLARCTAPSPRTIRAVPSQMRMSSISTRCGGNEPVAMLRPSESGAWPNRAESGIVQARDQAPKVNPTVFAAVIQITGRHDQLGLFQPRHENRFDR